MIESSSNNNKNKEITIELIKQLPKADLHRHLDGSIRISTLLELAKEQNVKLPSYDYKELSELILKDKGCTSLPNFLEAFSYTCSVLQQSYAITRVFYEMCEDAVNDGLSYLEVRFSPILHTQNSLSLSQVMEAVCDGQALVELKLQIKVRIIVCGLRHLDPSITKDLAEITWRYKNQNVTGFDLAGAEHLFSSKFHKEAFEIIRSKGINCTLHSGEDSGWESVADSIHYCGAHRIGHGIAIQYNDELLNHIINRRIPIECCITSNCQIQAISKPADHPIRKYFDRGAIVSIACDNVTMSNITLSHEYKLAIDTFSFTVEEVLRLIDYSFGSAFIDAPIKINLRRESFKKALKIFQSYDYDVSDVLNNKSYYFEQLGINVELEINLNNQIINEIKSSTTSTDSNELSTLIYSQLVTNSNNNNNHNKINFTLGKDIQFKSDSQITLELLENLPKSDLHSRFDGSVSIEQMWSEIELLGINKSIEKRDEFIKQLPSSKHLASTFLLDETNGAFKNFENFKNLIQSPLHSESSILLSKDIINLLLQSPDQINRAFDDIIKVSIKDNVKYIEMMIRPNSHTLGGLTSRQVLNLIIENKKKWEDSRVIRIGLVLFSSSTSDDPIKTFEIASLALENRDNGGVIGFGIFGSDPITPSESRHFQQTFSLLKQNNFNLVQFSGKSDTESIISCIHEAGASRLSGAFQVHKRPNLMSYCSNYSIPIEISLTEKLKSFTSDLSFTTPIRHLLDGNVPVVICSFRSSLYSYSRSQMLFEIVKNAKLDFKQVIKLLKNSFSHNFQHFNQRLELTNQFNQLSKQYLNQIKYDYTNVLI